MTASKRQAESAPLAIPANWAVMFDLGETLFEPLPAQYGEQNLLTYARQAGIEAQREKLLAMFTQSKAEVASEFARRSFYRHAEFVSRVFQVCCEAFGATPSPNITAGYIAAQHEAVVAWLRPRPDCFATLAALRSRGNRLAIVSNIDDDWLTPLVSRWELDTYVDIILSSESAESCKPDQKIFADACKAIATKPARCLFVGDDEANDVVGANRAGMTSVLFHKMPSSAIETQAVYVITELNALLR